MFGSPSTAKHFYVYSYEHLDDLSFLRTPAQVLNTEVVEWEEAIREELRKAGWEGDGRLKIMWLPPFVDAGVENTWGTYVWVVKQSNNGTSWIASPVELSFPRLRAQNGDKRVWDGRFPVSIARSDFQSFLSLLDRLSADLETDVVLMRSVSTRRAELEAGVLERSQGAMLQALGAFFDDCYLGLLREVVQDGNRSKLKLSKSQVRLRLDDYLPDDLDEDTGAFFTLAGFITDLWHAYRFQSFEERLNLLRRPLELEWEEDDLFELKKHVYFRNCVQHHAGQLEGKGFKRLGKSTLTIRGDGTLLTEWASVKLSIEELRNLASVLKTLAIQLESAIDEKVAARSYQSEKPLDGSKASEPDVDVGD